MNNLWAWLCASPLGYCETPYGSVKPPTIRNFTAAPAVLPVGGGDVTFNAQVKNAARVTLEGVVVVLPVRIRVTESHTFILVAYGAGNSTVSATAQVTVQLAAANPAQTIDSFVATPASITVGQSVHLAWATSNASQVYLDGVAVAADGSQNVAPTSNHTYTLQANGSAATVSQSIPVAVTALPIPAQTIDSFTATVTSITAGNSLTLSWATSNASQVYLDGVAVAADGSQTVTPTSNHTYTLQANGSAATVSQYIPVTVTAVPIPAQTIDSFTATATSITAGNSLTLSWATSNATEVRLDGVVVAADGSLVVSPTADHTYTLQAYGSVTMLTQAISVTVTVTLPTGGALTVSRDASSNMDPYNRGMQWYSMFGTNHGIVLAAGGFHSPGSSINGIRAYNPSTRTWAWLFPQDSYVQGGNWYAPTTTKWVSTDNVVDIFIPSLGGGTLIVGNQCVYDITSGQFPASNISTIAGFETQLPQKTVEQYVDMPSGPGAYRTLAGYNSACLWNDVVDYGISTTVCQGGNQNNSNRDYKWFWIEKTGDATKPVRVTLFDPPPVFRSPTFYADDGLGFGGWINARNCCAMNGEYFYVGGGFCHSDALDSTWFDRPNRRFFRIHLPTLKAATTDAQKTAAVTELARMPTAGSTYYTALTFDSNHNKLLWFSAEKIFCYDVAGNVWSNVTPTPGSLPNYDGWTPFPIPGWMAVYDPVTDAHYVREGSSTNDPRFADYNHTSQDDYAGRMRKVQFTAAVATTPGTFSVIAHGGGQPFNHIYSGMKHIALLYDEANDELIQAGGDYFGQVYMTVPTPSAPTPREYGPYHSGGKRDAWMCKPIANGAVLNWQCVQPMFMPYGQSQGPSGPDQIWWFIRTAGGRHEYYWMPGAWRGFQYETDNNLPVELKGDPLKAFKWLRPGWVALPARDKMPQSQVTNPTTQVGILTSEPDKFCAYDETTDSAYCINDDFEITQFDFSIMDWRVTRLGRPATDDSGRAITNGISSGGSLVARVGRRIYALGAWFEYVNGPTHSGLCWFDIDAGTRGFLPAPFDVDPLAFVPVPAPGRTFGERNPEESAGLVALNGELVVIRTYDVVSAGVKSIFVYNVAGNTWRDDAAPFPVWGRGWCALPNINSVLFFGQVDSPYEQDPSVFLYRVN